jgi:hypothetical protein
LRCNRDDKTDTQRAARAGKFVGKSAHRHDRGGGRDDDCGSTRRQPVALARLGLQASTKRLLLFDDRCRCNSLYFSSTSLNGTFQKISRPICSLALCSAAVAASSAARLAFASTSRFWCSVVVVTASTSFWAANAASPGVAPRRARLISGHSSQLEAVVRSVPRTGVAFRLTSPPSLRLPTVSVRVTCRCAALTAPRPGRL